MSTRSPFTVRSVGALASIALVSCIDDRSATPPEPSAQSHVVRVSWQVASIRKTDVLFVIDNSSSIGAHRPKLLANYPDMMNLLGTLQGGLPSIHIGVVTTDLGTRGADGTAGSDVAGCVGDGGGGRLHRIGAISQNFISDEIQPDRSRVRNYTGSLAAAFTELADVGGGGCGFTQPLEAMRRALDGNPSNAGFVRSGAYLAVIFITPNDDCSFAHGDFLDAGGMRVDPFRCVANANALVPIDEYVTFLESLKADPGLVIVSAIHGPPQPFSLGLEDHRRIVRPSCTYDGASAQPGVRLRQFIEGFPNRGTDTSICQSNLTDGLVLVAGFPDGHLGGDPCVTSALADVDPARPGRQVDCVAWYAFVDPRRDRVLPTCDGSNRPCWRLDVDARSCPQQDHELIRVEPGITELPPGTQFIAECVAD
jgi:hypothetical protein